MHLIVKNFSQLQTPLSAADIAGKLAIPIAIIQEVLAKLLLSHLLAELKEPDGSDEVYLPAIDIHILTISFVINALEQCGQNQLPESNQQPLLIDAVESFKSLIAASERNQLLKDI